MLPTNLVMVSPTLSIPKESASSRVDDWTADSGASNEQSLIDSAVHQLRAEIGASNYQLWFKQTSLAVHGDEFIVRVASPFLQTWLQRQFREAVCRVANRILGPSARTRFVVDGSLNQTSTAEQNSGRNTRTSETPGQLASSPVAALVQSPFVTGLNEEPVSTKSAAPRTPPSGNVPARRFASLSSFVVGSCNELAQRAVMQVAAEPGQRLNPLYLFGGVGLGKTHLLEGLYCELRRLHSTLNVLFLTSEQFTNYFTHALRTHTLPGFRQRFRGVDVLLIDDIDFLDGKRGIQEEFLHTLRSLEAHGKQLVVTSDRHPRLLSASSEELTTRFTSGLVCRLDAPDLPTRTGIVEQKLSGRNISVLPEAIALVAQWFRHNVRELEGALNCLEAHAILQRRPISAAMAREILADLQRDCVRIVKLADVERAICELFRIIPDELRSDRRARQISQPRMLAMYLARKLTQAAYSEIGEFFGGRNHSTVISAEKQVETWIASDIKLTLAAREWSVGELLRTLEQQALAG